MLFDEDDASLLKKWIVKRLEDISDADSDVLADYVLALLRHDQTEDEVKRLCVEQLDDFLREHTNQFVDDVFTALATKAFRSVNSTLTGGGLTVHIPTRHESPSLAMDTSPREPVHRTRSAGGNRVPKRSYYDRDEPDEEDRFKSAGGRERGSKMPRRSGHGPGRWVARGSLDGGNGRGTFKHTQPTAPGTAAPGQAPSFGMPMSAPGPFPAWMPPANPGDPMAAFLAAQAAAAWQFQTGGAKPDGEKKVVKKVGQRCKDYDEKGFCMKGDMCPYEHGVDHIVVPGQEPKSDGSFLHHASPGFVPLIRGAEYDPNDSMLFSASIDKRGRGGTARGRGSRGAIRGRRGGRAELSAMGPSFDHSNTKLVVEHIPEDKLSDSAIREFFGNFGTVENVEIQQHKNLAILKFATWDIAKAAYDSPAPIFDNRFVKVFWYKPADATASEILPLTANTLAPSRRFSTPGVEEPKEEEEEEKIDIEEVKRKQEERQKAYEEKMAKKMVNEEAAKELQKRKEELLKLQAEEKKKLMDKLAKKHAATAASTSPTPALEANGARSETPEKSKTAATTAALKAQLEALQAEAEALGIDHTASEDSFDLAGFRGRGRGRGRFSTRGGYIPRGRGFSTYRGRGSYVPRGRGGLPTMKLDNRTRKVAVTASDLKGDKEEAFRHYLINNGIELEAIESHPDKEDTQIFTFQDRQNAEKFVFSGNNIPDVGAVSMAWYNAQVIIKPSQSATGATDDVEMQMGEAASTADQGNDDAYDLAEDDDRWLPE